MPDLIFRRMKSRPESYDLTEYTYIAGGYTEWAAKALVDARIASWESGREPKPKVCPTCGRKMERE